MYFLWYVLNVIFPNMHSHLLPTIDVTGTLHWKCYSTNPQKTCTCLTSWHSTPLMNNNNLLQWRTQQQPWTLDTCAHVQYITKYLSLIVQSEQYESVSFCCSFCVRQKNSLKWVHGITYLTRRLSSLAVTVVARVALWLLEQSSHQTRKSFIWHTSSKGLPRSAFLSSGRKMFNWEGNHRLSHCNKKLTLWSSHVVSITVAITGNSKDPKWQN